MICIWFTKKDELGVSISLVPYTIRIKPEDDAEFDVEFRICNWNDKPDLMRHFSGDLVWDCFLFFIMGL
jgi:hypothetical protein